MKYNIRKLQQGGGFATFSPILPAPITPPSGHAAGALTTEAKKEEVASILDDKLYKELMDSKGLTSDVNVLIDQIVELESSPFAYLDSSNRTQSLMLMKKINELSRLKEDWTEALQNARQSGGLGEVAVGSSGEMFIQQNGKLKAVTASQVLKDREKYNPLTVAQLMNLRQTSEQLAFTSEVFSVANQSVGLDKIGKNIKDMLSIMSESSDTTERYYSKNQITDQIKAITGRTPAKEDIESLKLLTEIANTPGEYYKIVNESSTKRVNANRALNFIWNSLGREAQLKLKANAALNGESSPTKIIEDMIFTHTEGKTVSRISPQTEQSITGESGASKNLSSLTTFQMFHKQKMMEPMTSFALNDTKTGILFRGTVGAVSPLMTRNDEAIGPTTLNTILHGANYQLFVNQSEAYFGDKKIGVENMENIIYDGQDAGIVYMPVGPGGMPDYESFKEFKEIYTIFEQNKDRWTKEEAQRHFKRYNYNLQIDEVNGEKIIKENAYIKPFLVMYGWTNSATGLTKDNEWIDELSKDETKLIIPTLDQIWTRGTGKNQVNTKPDASWHKEKYYKGIITIPYRKGASASVDSLVKQGPKDKQYTIGDVQRNLLASSGVPTTGTGNAKILIE